MEFSDQQSTTLVASMLDEAGIAHGELRVRSISNNIAVSDGEAVFVKLLRPGFDSALLETELLVAQRYGAELAGSPLATELLQVKDRKAAVWRYEELQPLLPQDATAQDGAGLATLLNRIHSQSAEALQPMESLEFMLPKVEHRLEYGAAQGASVDTLRILRELRDRYLLGESFSAEGLCHGDTHLGNAARTASGYRWYDWESARAAPREFDCAGLFVNLALVGSNRATWNAARSVLEEETLLRDDLLKTLIVARLISICSYALIHPGGLEVARLRAEAVEPLLRGSDFPESIPSLDGYR